MGGQAMTMPLGPEIASLRADKALMYGFMAADEKAANEAKAEAEKMRAERDSYKAQCEYLRAEMAKAVYTAEATCGLPIIVTDHKAQRDKDGLRVPVEAGWEEASPLASTCGECGGDVWPMGLHECSEAEENKPCWRCGGTGEINCGSGHTFDCQHCGGER